MAGPFHLRLAAVGALGVPALQVRVDGLIRDAHARGLIVAPAAKAKAKGLFACFQGTLTQARIQNNAELLCEFKAIALDVLGAKPAGAPGA
jgi:hypothetical protein